MTDDDVKVAWLAGEPVTRDLKPIPCDCPNAPCGWAHWAPDGPLRVDVEWR